MTPEHDQAEWEAIAHVAALTALTPDDVRGLLACDEEQLRAIFQTYRDDAVRGRLSVWQQADAIFSEVSTLAAKAAPIIGVAAAILVLV